MTESDPLIAVRRDWSDYQSAQYPLSKIEQLHWSRYSGGVFRPAPREFVRGYVWCNEATAGAVAHSCQHPRGQSHRIKITIVKKDNKSAFAAILARVEQYAQSTQKIRQAAESAAD